MRWAELLKLSVDRSILFDFVNLVFEVFQTEQRWISVRMVASFDVDRACGRLLPLSLPTSTEFQGREVGAVIPADVPSDERLAERGAFSRRLEWSIGSSDGVQCVSRVCEDLHRSEELHAEKCRRSGEHC